MNPFASIFEKAVKPLAIKALLARERLESGVAFNPLSSKLRANPYPTYEELRRKDPVHRMRLMDSWALTNLKDVDMVLRDQRRFGNEGRDFGYIPYISMLDLDPPAHTRIRSLVAKGFTPRSVAALEPRVRATVDQLLDDLNGRERIDLIQDFAFPLPIIVIAELLGIPPEDRDQFDEWSNVVSLTVDPLLNDTQIRQVRRAVEELFDYFEAIAASTPRVPRGRPGQRSGQRRGGRGALEPGRPANKPGADAGGRQRDYPQPYRQRNPGPAAPPGATATAAG